MDQEGHAPVSKRKTIEEDANTQDSVVQNVDDTTVDKSVCSSAVDLINDAWLLVFSYLGIEDRIRIARVCRRWEELAHISWKSITRMLLLENMFKPPMILWNDYEPIELLEVFMRRCGPRLRSVDLSTISCHVPCIPNNALALVSQYCTSLKELNISKVPITETAKNTLAKRRPRLRFLNLQDCCRFEGHELDDYVLSAVVKMLPSLQSLNVARNWTITGEFFSQAPQSLTKVFAKCCRNLTDRGVRLLAERCPNLETIDISMSSSITGQSITALATNCPKLKIFKFNMLRQANNVLAADYMTLSNLTLLEELHMDWNTANAVTDEVFYELGRHCPFLRSISCGGYCKLTNAAIYHLSPCLHLESINLSYCFQITDEGLIQLSSAHFELKKVDLTDCNGITDRGVGHLLSDHPNLLELKVTSCRRVTNSVLPMLESSLQRREYTQPLMISFAGTSVDSYKVNRLSYAKRISYAI